MTNQQRKPDARRVASEVGKTGKPWAPIDPWRTRGTRSTADARARLREKRQADIIDILTKAAGVEMPSSVIAEYLGDVEQETVRLDLNYLHAEKRLTYRAHGKTRLWRLA